MVSSKQKLLSAAFGGLFAASMAFSQDAAPTPPATPDAGANKMEPHKMESKAEAPAATAATGECHGINGCKGQGDCGGKGHECAGKNKCKGHGWKKMTKEECKDATMKMGKKKKMHFSPSK